MAYSKLSFTATAGQQTYYLTFPVLETDDVQATVDGSSSGVVFTIGGDWAGGSGTITFSSPTFAGTEAVVVSRDSGSDRLVDYQSGAAITEADLDLDSKHPLFLTEEEQVYNAETYQALAEKGQAGGYAGLDGAGLVPKAQLGVGSASAATFLRGDGSWAVVVGGGGASGVYGPPVTVVGNVALWDSLTGELLKDSGKTIADLQELGSATGYLPAAQVSGLADVATSGDYGDLLNLPTIPASLGDLDDVTLGTPNDGEVLTWSDVAAAWVAAEPTGGGGTGGVSGPTVSVQHAIATWDDITGDTLRSSAVSVDTAGDIILNTTGAKVDGVDVSTLPGQITALQATAPTASQKSALAGVGGTPGVSNPYVTDTDTRLDPFVGDDSIATPAVETEGLVPKPAHLDWLGNYKFLAANGTWQRVAASMLQPDVALGIPAGGTAATSYFSAFYNLAPQVGAGTDKRGYLIVRSNVAAPGLTWQGLAPGSDGHVLIADSTQDLGVKWDAVAGTGDVTGPGGVNPVVEAELAAFDGTTGKALQGTSILTADVDLISDPYSTQRVSGSIAVDHLLKTVRCTNIPRTPQLDANNGTTGAFVIGTPSREVITWTSAPLIYNEASSPPAGQGGGGCAGLHFFGWRAIYPKKQNPFRYVFFVRCPPDLTNLRLAVGLFNYNPTGYASPDAAQDHQSLYFRYISGDSKWTAISSDGNGSDGVSLASTVSLVADLFMTLELVGTPNGADYDVAYIVNGVTGATFNSGDKYMPGNTLGLTGDYFLRPAVRLTNTASSSRSLGFAGMTFYQPI